jgi:hypothetical protein
MRRPAERAFECVVIVRWHPHGSPSLDDEPLLDSTRPSVAGRIVVDDDRREAVETEASGDGDGLVVRALVELGVAHETEHAGPTRDESRSSSSARRGARATATARTRTSAGACGLQPERQAHGDSQTVAERSARYLDTGNEQSIRVIAER